MPKAIPDAKIERLALLADLIIANPARLKMFMAVSENEKSVSALAELTGISMSAASQHLAKLKAYGVTSTRRDAQTMYYSASPKAQAELKSLLTEVLG